MTKFTYTDFTGRKKRSDVRRVYDGSHGYIITDEDVKTDKGELIRFSKAGCTYAEWLAGKKPEPIRELYCPYLWRNEGIGNEPLQRCKRHCRGFGSITSCEVYGDKQTCWEIYDAMRQEVSP